VRFTLEDCKGTIESENVKRHFLKSQAAASTFFTGLAGRLGGAAGRLWAKSHQPRSLDSSCISASLILDFKGEVHCGVCVKLLTASIKAHSVSPCKASAVRAAAAAGVAIESVSHVDSPKIENR
jgi:hypothetical protein